MATAQKGTEFAACVSKSIKMAIKCLSMLFNLYNSGNLHEFYNFLHVISS